MTTNRLSTAAPYRELDRNELNRAIAHARNKRDAYSAGREPQETMVELHALLSEQARRRRPQATSQPARRLPVKTPANRANASVGRAPGA